MMGPAKSDIGAAIAALAERADGVVLAIGAAGLSAITSRGTRLWHRALGHAPDTSSISPSIAVDAMGRAFVGSADGLVRAIAPNGLVPGRSARRFSALLNGR